MAFYFFNAQTQNLSANNTSARITLNNLQSITNTPVLSYEIQNNGSQAVFLAWGDSTVTAVATTGYPILPGQSKIVTIPTTTDNRRITDFAFITAAAGATPVYITPGTGE